MTEKSGIDYGLEKGIFFLLQVSTDCGAHPVSYPEGIGEFFIGDQPVGHEA
jgi:hypothetical protein